MRTIEIISLLAIIIGPILAVQIQKYLERIRDNKNRKVNIFKTLMATRGTSLSTLHVEALNRIDLEFSNIRKYRKVVEAWKEYFDNLSNPPKTDQDFTLWGANNIELFINLLYEMGHSLGFKFDKVVIKRNIYSPEGHARIERENNQMRLSLLKILEGEQAFPINLKQAEITSDAFEIQKKLQELMIKYYQKELEKGN